MTSIEGKLRAIVIPSGNEQQDIERAKAAIMYNARNGSRIPYIISGIGTEINEALNGEKKGDNVNFHRELYDYIMRHTRGVVGMDIRAVNSNGNITETFPFGVTGRYALVSYPLHLRRFEAIVKKSKREGKISPDLQIEYVPTRSHSTPREMIYEAGSWTKRILRNLRSKVA